MPIIERPASIFPEDGAVCGSGLNQLGDKRPPLSYQESIKVMLTDGRLAALYDTDNMDEATNILNADYSPHERVLVILPDASSYSYIRIEEIQGIAVEIPVLTSVDSKI